MWSHRVNEQTIGREKNVGELQRHNGKLESLQSSAKTRKSKETEEEVANARIRRETKANAKEKERKGREGGRTRRMKKNNPLISVSQKVL